MEGAILEGVRVIDLSSSIAGPYCTKLLALLGAEVIKVEETGVGDSTRRMGPFPGDVPHPERSGLFLYLNTNKKSVTLDLKSASGRDVFTRLAAKADAVVESFGSGVLDQLGLDFPSLEQINPRLVLTSISPWGHSGPYSEWRGGEIVSLAMSGLMSTIGAADRQPIGFGSGAEQYFVGLSAFTSTMAALYYVQRTGLGQRVDVCETEAFATLHPEALVRYAYTGETRKRAGYGLVFQCKDGYATLGGQPYQWPRVCQAMGMPELADHPKFNTPENRQQNAQELREYVRPWMEARTMEEVYHAGQAERAPASYFALPSSLLSNPQYLERNFFVELDHPEAGRQTYPGMPARMGNLIIAHQRAPLLGEHNWEIYRGLLGYSEADLVSLRQASII